MSPVLICGAVDRALGEQRLDELRDLERLGRVEEGGRVVLVALQPLEAVDQQRQATGGQLAPRGERSRHAGVGRLDELVVVEESRGQGEQRAW